MAHLELSLSEPVLADVGGAVDRWAAVTARAEEPCLLLDRAGIVVAASPGFGRLFSINAADTVGRAFVDVLRLLDFNLVSGELPGRDVERIPPLLAITGVLARGLLRVAAVGGAAETVDAISAPVRENGAVVGSLTFFAQVGR